MRWWRPSPLQTFASVNSIWIFMQAYTYRLIVQILWPVLENKPQTKWETHNDAIQCREWKTCTQARTIRLVVFSVYDLRARVCVPAATGNGSGKRCLARRDWMENGGKCWKNSNAMQENQSVGEYCWAKRTCLQIARALFGFFQRILC